MLLAAGKLTSPDYLVILVYLAGTIVLGIWIGRRLKTGSDFFLAGRNLPWWAIGMSLVATDIGGTDIIGVGGAAYAHGLAVANFEWIGCVPAMIVAAFVFVPFLYRSGVYTVPEYLERRYNAGVRTLLAMCWLLFMACNLGIMLLASGKMMSAVFGWDVAACIWTTAILVGFYTCVGGLAAVVYTDMIQCVVMIAGCLLVLAFGLYEVGGIGGLMSRLRDVDGLSDGAAVARAQLILPVDTPSPFPWTGIYFGLALILSPAYWIGNQAIIQRSLGARSEFEAKASYIWGAVLKNVIPVIIAVPGLIAVALFPHLEDGDRAIPMLVSELLPVGFRGMFVAAFLAALMSSIDSYLNSAATIVSNDIYHRFIDRNVTEERLLTVGRVTTFGFVVWAIGFAFLLTRLKEGSGIYAIFQTLMAFFQGPALAVLLTGVLWKRATGAAALTGFILGIATSVSLFALNQPAVTAALGLQPLFQTSEPFLYFSVWAFLATLAVIVTGSFLTRPEPAEKLTFTYRRHVAPEVATET